MKTKVTYLGGPTYLLEIGNFRILSDPAFDAQGSWKDEGPGHLLTKVMEAPVPAEEIGKIDLVLISHTHHLDNFDNKGREIAAKADLILTTPASVEHGVEGNPEGLDTWQTREVTNASGETLKITATPAVHTSNPDLREAVGEVTGFMLEWDGQEKGAFYISGDTVYIPELAEISKRFNIAAAIFHMGAANVPAVGDNVLTMTAVDGARAAKEMDIPHIYPAHFEGWRHFTEGSWKIERAFEKDEVIDRLHLLLPGGSEEVDI